MHLDMYIWCVLAEVSSGYLRALPRHLVFFPHSVQDQVLDVKPLGILTISVASLSSPSSSYLFANVIKSGVIDDALDIFFEIHLKQFVG